MAIKKNGVEYNGSIAPTAEDCVWGLEFGSGDAPTAGSDIKDFFILQSGYRMASQVKFDVFNIPTYNYSLMGSGAALVQNSEARMNCYASPLTTIRPTGNVSYFSVLKTCPTVDPNNIYPGLFLGNSMNNQTLNNGLGIFNKWSLKSAYDWNKLSNPQEFVVSGYVKNASYHIRFSDTGLENNMAYDSLKSSQGVRIQKFITITTKKGSTYTPAPGTQFIFACGNNPSGPYDFYRCVYVKNGTSPDTYSHAVAGSSLDTWQNAQTAMDQARLNYMLLNSTTNAFMTATNFRNCHTQLATKLDNIKCYDMTYGNLSNGKWQTVLASACTVPLTLRIHPSSTKKWGSGSYMLKYVCLQGILKGSGAANSIYSEYGGNTGTDNCNLLLLDVNGIPYHSNENEMFAFSRYAQDSSQLLAANWTWQSSGTFGMRDIITKAGMSGILNPFSKKGPWEENKLSFDGTTGTFKQMLGTEISLRNFDGYTTERPGEIVFTFTDMNQSTATAAVQHRTDIYSVPEIIYAMTKHNNLRIAIYKSATNPEIIATVDCTLTINATVAAGVKYVLTMDNPEITLGEGDSTTLYGQFLFSDDKYASRDYVIRINYYKSGQPQILIQHPSDGQWYNSIEGFTLDAGVLPSASIIATVKNSQGNYVNDLDIFGIICDGSATRAQFEAWAADGYVETSSSKPALAEPRLGIEDADPYRVNCSKRIIDGTPVYYITYGLYPHAYDSYYETEHVAGNKNLRIFLYTKTQYEGNTVQYATHTATQSLQKYYHKWKIVFGCYSYSNYNYDGDTKWPSSNTYLKTTFDFRKSSNTVSHAPITICCHTDKKYTYVTDDLEIMMQDKSATYFMQFPYQPDYTYALLPELLNVTYFSSGEYDPRNPILNGRAFLLMGCGFNGSDTNYASYIVKDNTAEQLGYSNAINTHKVYLEDLSGTFGLEYWMKNLPNEDVDRQITLHFPPDKKLADDLDNIIAYVNYNPDYIPWKTSEVAFEDRTKYYLQYMFPERTTEIDNYIRY